MPTKKLKATNIIKINLMVFHREILAELRRNAFYSFKTITEEILLTLVDPMVSFLLFITPNFQCHRTSNHRRLKEFYGWEDLFEVFDELILKFNAFLRDHGVDRYKRYTVYRNDNINTTCVELDSR